MCGINGFSWGQLEQINKMNIISTNRGPDDTGTYVNDDVSLGHNRLSIIDLSMNGHQPMSNEDGSVIIVYNGEIYNFLELRPELEEKGHIFKSNTDTEVVIHAYEEYGPDCVQKFNGMWAFCIYDVAEERLLLCRDQYGIKPLYYNLDNNRIIFSSMISPILCHNINSSPNEQAIYAYLAFGLEDHTDETFFSGIKSLTPGCYLTYSLKEHKHSMSKWYSPQRGRPMTAPELRKLFIDSIELRTRADVEVGSCLSGGIDSSAIVCTLETTVDKQVKTFSFVADGSIKDETQYIAEVGKHCSLDQHFTKLNPAEFISECQDFITCQEEPVTTLSPYAQYRVMKLAHSTGTKVLLDGQGGDELFLGYEFYYPYLFYEKLSQLKIASFMRETIVYTLKHQSVYPHMIFLFQILPKPLQRYIFMNNICPWINYHYFRDCDLTGDPRWVLSDTTDCQKLTLYTTVIPHLLRWEDKNSMRWGIESRPPFLDYRLVEAALALPSEEKIGDGDTKIIFKKAIGNLLPELIRTRKNKIGFEVSDDDFFRNPEVGHFCRKIIYSQSFRSRSYWNWDAIEKRYRDHMSGKINIGKEIWKWINLELWLKTFFPNIDKFQEGTQD